MLSSCESLDKNRIVDSHKLHLSAYFNPAWYCQRYPDVVASGYSPEQHFLEFGAVLRRSPSPEFDTDWYLRRYPDVAASGMNPLLHFLRYGCAEGRAPRELPGEPLEAALWCGEYTRGALRGLWALSTHDDMLVRGQAAWALARWYATREEWSTVLDALQGLSPEAERFPYHPGPWLLEIEALRQQGRLEDAYRRLDALRCHFPKSDEPLLARINLIHDDAGVASDTVGPQGFSQRLLRLNQVWQRAGLARVVITAKANCFDDLVQAELPAEPCAGGGLGQSTQNNSLPLVTVIVPIYNAATTLPTALSSLQAQTYTPLEILLVDDASTDASRDVAERFAREDTLFRVLPQAENSGAYVARNAGLAAARGSLITVHDSDDWSHPQKIERQVNAMRHNEDWVACLTDWVRCAEDLVLKQWRMDTSWALENLSSLMFRREVSERLGYWDRVKVSGDREYLNRIQAAYGPNAVGKVDSGVPLALGRYRDASLTQTKPTHLVTMFRGLRYEYTIAAQTWHGAANSLYLPRFPRRRPFPAPEGNLVEEHQGVSS